MRIKIVSRRNRVVGVLGGEDRCQVRKRVCRWSRERGSILVQDESGQGKMYNREWISGVYQMRLLKTSNMMNGKKAIYLRLKKAMFRRLNFIHQIK
jgi:hypothetical protein